MAATFVASPFGAAPRAATWGPLPMGRPRRAETAPPPAVAAVPVVVAPAAPEVDVDALRAEAAAIARTLEEERAAHARTRAELEKARAERREDAAEAGALARLHEVAEGLLAARRRGVEEVRDGLATLVLGAARKLAGEGLRAQPGLIEQLVEDTVALLGREGLVVRVNPRDVDRVTRALTGLGAQVHGDPQVDAGCVASTPFGAVDASVGTAEAALRAVVEAWRTAGWSAEDTSPVPGPR